jgi:hypothetical protein
VIDAGLDRAEMHRMNSALVRAVACIVIGLLTLGALAGNWLVRENRARTERGMERLSEGIEDSDWETLTRLNLVAARPLEKLKAWDAAAGRVRRVWWNLKGCSPGAGSCIVEATLLRGENKRLQILQLNFRGQTCNSIFEVSERRHS